MRVVSVRSAMVRLIPSRDTDPFGMRYIRCSLGKVSVSSAKSALFLKWVILAVSSMWPERMCPPSFVVGVAAVSRLMRVFSLMFPSVVLLSVSGR